MGFFNSGVQAEEVPVVTIDSPLCAVLSEKTMEIDNWGEAREIADRLYWALKPYFPAAGMAAPQIGVNKSVFIFSYDRDPAHLEAVVNPNFMPIGEEKISGWEGCLSVITDNWMLAKVSRYVAIKVTYWNLDGEMVEKILDGFAAKVFQHEYDHLQGIVNIYREDAEVKVFASKEEMQNFIAEVKKEDANRYKKPD